MSLSLDTYHIGGDYNIIIKKKYFDPSPFAGKIPFEADSTANPKCIGTRLYTEFWEEMIYYSIHGYDTGGLHISGKYFEYLNFEMIDGVGYGKEYPMYADLHYQLFTIEDEIRKDPFIAGGNMPKARRKGLSFFFKQILLHGARFKDMYRAGVVGGLDTYVDGFRSKLYRTFNDTVPEFQLNHLKKDNEFLILGWEPKTDFGFARKEHATILFKTISNDSRKLEGEYFDDIVYEESGENKNVEEAHVSNFPAQKRGEEFVGKSWFIGTGGRMNKSGKAFSTICSNNKSYYLVNMFIPGKRFYFPYMITNNSRYTQRVPYLEHLFKDHSPEQLLGCEDILAASESLKKEEENLLKNPDRTKYLQHKQNFPETVEDVFISSGSNNFDIELLFSRNFYLNGLASPMYSEKVFEWKKTESGDIAQPAVVIMRDATKYDPEWKRILVYKGPDAKYSGTDVMGVDGYNEDQSLTTKSLGAFIILRQFKIHKEVNITEPGIVPILVYYKRPPRKEQFFEMALQAAIHYGLIKNVLVSAEADLVIQYFKNFPGGKKYLAKRPRTFDSPESKLIHEFGIKMNTYSKPRMISLMQTWVMDNILYCWFPMLCSDLASYDTENMGTDWDLSDALGIALCLIEDKKKKHALNAGNEKEEEEPEIEWRMNSRGFLEMYRPGQKIHKNAFEDDL